MMPFVGATKSLKLHHTYSDYVRRDYLIPSNLYSTWDHFDDTNPYRGVILHKGASKGWAFNNAMVITVEA